MKRQALLLIIFALIGSLMGSYLTYTWYIQKINPVQAESSIKNASVTIAKNDESQQVALNESIVGSNAVVKAVEKLSPSVVYITTRSRVANSGRTSTPPGFPDEFDSFSPNFYGPRERKGSGSGIIISDNGLILTNQHVVDGATQIKVKVNLSDNGSDDKTRTYDAKIIGEDRLTDVAILKIEAEGLKAATLGNSDDIKVGEWVIAVGNPLGYEHTVTVGVLSAKGRNIPFLSDREYPNLLQTDAAINPGNSGGPLANLNGEVIGMNTVVSAYGQGIGFAIPVNRIKKIKDQLINRGKVSRAFMGIQMTPMDAAKAEYFRMPKTEGVLVYRVFRGTPAYIAGMKRGDVILEVDGTMVNSPEELQKKIRATDIGKELQLKIWRNGSPMMINVKVGEMPDPGRLKVRR